MITRDDVVRAGRLSRIKLTDAETARFAADLERIVGYVDEIMKVDVTGVAPMTHPHDTPRTRDDVAGPVLGHAALTALEDSMVRVPKVID